MRQYVCPGCKRVAVIAPESPIPSECAFCYTLLPPDIEVTSQEVVKQPAAINTQKVRSMTLICQKTFEQIEIPAVGATVLGRNNHGADLFDKIRNSRGEHLISRKHCTIAFSENAFYATDLGSTNGLFYTTNRIRCQPGTPQLLENGNCLYFGNEVFLIQMHLEEQIVSSEPVNPPKALYRCNGQTCGYESDVALDVCPRCSDVHSFRLVQG